MVLSFGLRMFIYHQGLKIDPWTYRFFPCEIFFFLAGNMAYRGYCFIKTKPVALSVKIAAWVAVVGGLLLFNLVPIRYFVKQWAFYMLFIGALPFIFLLTKRFLWDRAIGELSYPVYITHWMVVFYVVPLINQYVSVSKIEGVIAVGITIGISLLIMKYVVDPIEKIRSSRVPSIKTDSTLLR
jgi:peptidoglycan/LPS O-acetylase OafA/YrhL